MQTDSCIEASPFRLPNLSWLDALSLQSDDPDPVCTACTSNLE